jgi:hypothetical protein
MCGFMSLSRSANSPHPYNASVFVASAVNMMAAQSVSMDKYTKREQQVGQKDKFSLRLRFVGQKDKFSLRLRFEAYLNHKGG